MPKVFVYGTLKKGYHNHRVLGSNPKFCGKATTPPDYLLYDNGSYPCMIQATAGEGRAVEGEVYEVPDSQMVALDRLEGVPWLYERATIELPGHGPVIGYIYQRSVSQYLDCGSSWPRQTMAG